MALSAVGSALVHINRNVIVKFAYEEKVDYLIFIDTDMMWSSKHIEKLVESGKDVISGLYTTRNLPQRYCVYDDNGNNRCKFIEEVPDVPFRCFAVGAGFLLLTQKVIRKMWDDKWKEGYPFDLMSHGLAYGKANVESMCLGEDISFSRRVHRQNFEIWCDPSVRIGHVAEVVRGKVEDEMIFKKRDNTMSQMFKRHNNEEV